MVKHLQYIANTEEIAITPEALLLVAQIAQGGLRDAESLLDQLSLLEGEITSEKVWDLVGAVPERDLLTLLQAIEQDSPQAVLDASRHLMDRGREPLIVLQNLAGFYRDLLIAKTASDRLDLVALTPSTWTQLGEMATRIDLQTILLGQQHLRSSEVQIKNSTQPRLWLEVTLMGLLPSALQPRTHASPTSLLASKSLAPSSRVQSLDNPVLSRSKVVPSKSVETPAPVPQSESPQSAIQSFPSTTQAGSTPVPPEQIASSSHSPPASTPEPLTKPEPEVELNLDHLWQQVLEAIAVPSTRMLLRQQGSLLNFNGKVAQLGISQQWLKKIQDKLPLIETAWTQVCQRPVQIVLKKAAPPKAPSPLPEQPSPVVSELPSVAPDQGLKPVKNSAPPSVAAPQPETLPPELPASEQSWASENEVLAAAKSLAQFFNGEVVKLDNVESDSPESIDPSSLDTEDMPF
jgi:DNA polymerase-3 subunit gamma/tau